MADGELCNSLCRSDLFPSDETTKRRKRRRKPRLTGLSKQRQTANARERSRMRSISTALLHLRYHLPTKFAPKEKRLSKIQTLRYAILYIAELLQLLKSGERQEDGECGLATAVASSGDVVLVEAEDAVQTTLRGYGPKVSVSRG